MFRNDGGFRNQHKIEIIKSKSRFNKFVAINGNDVSCWLKYSSQSDSHSFSQSVSQSEIVNSVAIKWTRFNNIMFYLPIFNLIKTLTKSVHWFKVCMYIYIYVYFIGIVMVLVILCKQYRYNIISPHHYKGKQFNQRYGWLISPSILLCI